MNGGYAELTAAVRTFVAKLDECQPHIDDAFFMAFARKGDSYSGPQYGAELRRLRDALTAATAEQRAAGDVETPTFVAAIRAHVAVRARRVRRFDAALFGEPAWDILLDLALARMSSRRVQISGAGGAAGVPPTTALRHISELEKHGFICRVPDPNDRRRQWLEITDEGFAALASVMTA